MKKIPREWMLERHAGAKPALGRVRRAVLREERLSGWDFLRELFVPVRGTWAALALVWVLLLGSQWFLQKGEPVQARSASRRDFVCFSTSTKQIDAILNETGALR